MPNTNVSKSFKKFLKFLLIILEMEGKWSVRVSGPGLSVSSIVVTYSCWEVKQG